MLAPVAGQNAAALGGWIPMGFGPCRADGQLCAGGELTASAEISAGRKVGAGRRGVEVNGGTCVAQDQTDHGFDPRLGEGVGFAAVVSRLREGIDRTPGKAGILDGDDADPSVGPEVGHLAGESSVCAFGFGAIGEDIRCVLGEQLLGTAAQRSSGLDPTTHLLRSGDQLGHDGGRGLGRRIAQLSAHHPRTPGIQGACGYFLHQRWRAGHQVDGVTDTRCGGLAAQAEARSHQVRCVHLEVA